MFFCSFLLTHCSLLRYPSPKSSFFSSLLFRSSSSLSFLACVTFPLVSFFIFLFYSLLAHNILSLPIRVFHLFLSLSSFFFLLNPHSKSFSHSIFFLPPSYLFSLLFSQFLFLSLFCSRCSLFCIIFNSLSLIFVIHTKFTPFFCFSIQSYSLFSSFTS